MMGDKLCWYRKVTVREPENFSRTKVACGAMNAIGPKILNSPW